jgi:hypothetical protein
MVEHDLKTFKLKFKVIKVKLKSISTKIQHSPQRNLLLHSFQLLDPTILLSVLINNVFKNPLFMEICELMGCREERTELRY